MARLTVLLAEADPLRGLVLASQVRALGHRLVGPAYSRAETLGLARESDMDIAVIDVELDEGSGAETAEAVFRVVRTPVVLLAPYQGAPAPSPHLSAFHLLTKPVSVEDLGSGIAAARRRFDAWRRREREVAGLAEAEVFARAARALVRGRGLPEDEAERWLREQGAGRDERVLETARALLIADGLTRGARS